MDIEVLIECDHCKSEVDILLYDEKLNICNTCKKSPQQIFILSIDIGIQHLAMVLSSTTTDYHFQEIIWMELTDITIFTCDKNCKLHHDKTFADWMLHILEKYYNIFKQATHILIERQPPQGLVVVEQILFGSWRDKSILISPNSVHKYFSIGDLDYENRKIASVNISKKYITSDSLKTQLLNCDRIHDISDCILFTIFWLSKKKEENEIQTLIHKREQAFKKVNQKLGMSLDDFFDMYRYIPSNLS